MKLCDEYLIRRNLSHLIETPKQTVSIKRYNLEEDKVWHFFIYTNRDTIRRYSPYLYFRLRPMFDGAAIRKCLTVHEQQELLFKYLPQLEIKWLTCRQYMDFSNFSSLMIATW